MSLSDNPKDWYVFQLELTDGAVLSIGVCGDTVRVRGGSGESGAYFHVLEGKMATADRTRRAADPPRLVLREDR